MTAVVELIVTASTRVEASAAMAAEVRAISRAESWDTSDLTCARILAWLHDRERAVMRSGSHPRLV